ncbi:hypothetical protein E4U21_007406, partial [Claviceps maximensis]
MEYHPMTPARRQSRRTYLEVSVNGHDPTHRLQTTLTDDLKNPTYINRAADRCLWNGRDCVFERTEFDVDIEVIEAEMRVRETLLDAMVPATQPESMPKWQDASPIVNSAQWPVSIRHPPASHPEMLVRDHKDNPPLMMNQLRDLVRGAEEFVAVGKCSTATFQYRNTVLQPGGQDSDSAKSMFIDVTS